MDGDWAMITIFSKSSQFLMNYISLNFNEHGGGFGSSSIWIWLKFTPILS
jgi:hypothetical protein